MEGIFGRVPPSHILAPVETIVRLPRAWYSADLQAFHQGSTESVLGALVERSTAETGLDQRDAWVEQIRLLRAVTKGLKGQLYFEFSIPRMGRRADVVLLLGPLVIVLEFKVGARTFDHAAREQVWDYALDLKNFHEGSHHIPLVPILVATSAAESPGQKWSETADRVFSPMCSNADTLRGIIDAAVARCAGPHIDRRLWEEAPYRPTPTIIEAARTMYSQHSVAAITRRDASARNLHATASRLDEVVKTAADKQRKVICFVTGVPGAGKTLVGLNLATQHTRGADASTHAVFLSGNGPLVAVLREALTRDEVQRLKRKREKATKKVCAKSVNAFIQNVHHFRDEALRHPGPPADHVVIFDEAQRAWNLQQTANFMRRKRGVGQFAQSEAEFLIGYMDRHKDWAAVVCLVGGGQEINTGEAGIEAWLSAAREQFPHWDVYISSRLVDQEYMAGATTQALGNRERVYFDESLHLAVSMRSFRAENVSAFVEALLDGQIVEARNNFRRLSSRYPLRLTRDLGRAKRWLRERARGSERVGIVASSKALRLKPHAIDIRVEVNPIHYFLANSEDPRSSNFLEDAATEFQVQGLELDWACVTWDADLRRTPRGWTYQDFAVRIGAQSKRLKTKPISATLIEYSSLGHGKAW